MEGHAAITESSPIRAGVSIEAIRARFPALGSDTVYLDNAGGSQVPRIVADRMHEYMLSTYVQLGADYDISRQSTATVRRAHEFIRLFMNGDGVGEVALGASTSALCAMLADCYARALDPGRDEIIICQTGHESNIGAWERLSKRGYTVRIWEFDADSQTCRIEDLHALLNSRTRLVTFPHVSNILGRIEAVEEAIDAAHEAGARVVVDGVAYAPHRAIDVKALRADWYVYSTYKVYGPHMAALFGTHDAFAELEGPNHYFVDRKAVPYKFELGGASHEGCAGLLALWEYLCTLTHDQPREEWDRTVIEHAFEVMTAHELPLQERLIGYLLEHPRVRLIGPEATDDTRVCTISFVHESKSSRDIAQAGNARKMGFRYGNFYAWRLCETMGLDPSDGVVRISGVHYNTPGEFDRLITVLDEIL